jgi:hypothetical protein
MAGTMPNNCFNQKQLGSSPETRFFFIVTQWQNYCANAKIPYPRPPETQESNIPINRDQCRSMAEQMRKQTIQQNQPNATPERDFSPLFNNGKNH